MHEGAGIGWMHANDVADAYFFALAEMELIETNAYAYAGILAWYRFRDDRMLIATSGPSFRMLVDTVHAKASFFQVNIEDISTV